jgi:amino acid transporter
MEEDDEDPPPLFPSLASDGSPQGQSNGWPLDADSASALGLPAAAVAGVAPLKRVTAFQLAMMTFFLTTGGPFGSEPAIGAGGMLYTLIGFIVVPLVWSLPQGLMAAELSLMFPSNGGPIFWVYHAFGALVGWVNAYNTIVYYFLCDCLIVSLFTFYFPELENFWVVTGVRFGLMLVVGLLNLFSVSWISYVFSMLIFLVELPFYVMLVVTIVRGDFDLSRLADRPGLREVDWPLFVSLTTWCFGGYDSLGSLAGEAKSPRHFIFGMALSLPMTMLNYLVPLCVGYMSDPNWENWNEGHYSEVAYDIGLWLGVWIVTASALSNFGQVNAGTTSIVRLMWAMASGEASTTTVAARSPAEVDEKTSLTPEEHSLADVLQAAPPATGIEDSEFAGVSERMLPGIFSWTLRCYPLDSPIVGVVVSSFLTALVASLVDFSYLVELTTSMRVLQLLLEYGALTMLRFRMPHHSRPFRVPLGYFGTIVIALPSVAICVLLVSLQDLEVTLVGFGINILFILMFLMHRVRALRHQPCRFSLPLLARLGRSRLQRP